jgi:hypothetical protein
MTLKDLRARAKTIGIRIERRTIMTFRETETSGVTG